MRGSMETSAADPVVAPAAGESTSAALGADASLGVILPAPPTGAEVVGDRSVQRDGGPREPASSDFARVDRGSDDLARQTRIWESIRHEVRCQHSAPESADLFREVMAICDDQITKGHLACPQI